MTYLEAVAAHLPGPKVTVGAYLRELGVDPVRIKVHQRYFGFGEVRLEPGAGLAAQLVSAAAGLPGLGGLGERVRYVIQARTMQVVALYPANPLREVCEALGLTRASAFSVTQHSCASGLLAVDLAGKLLAADPEPDALALVLAGEKVFTSQPHVIANTGVMGEGAAAVLIGRAGDRDRVLGYATRTLGRFHLGGRASPELNAELTALYPETLADVMLTAVRSAGLRLGDIALVLPHHVSRTTWTRVQKQLADHGTPAVFLDNLARIGHCFGADCFINYRTALDLGRIRPGDHYLMTAVGLGAIFSAMVLRH